MAISAKSQNGIEERISELLSQMTLREKVSMLSGADAWHTVAIPRLGIPAITMSDGPHGVRAADPGTGRKVGPATSFPTGISMASTWNEDLMERAAVALGQETRYFGCDVLLGPCVNIVRGPLGGRNFETYSEDPYLAGRMGIAYVKGLQSQKIAASLKHFAANNQEYERFRGSSEVDERTLHEIYLTAFEMVVKETQPWSVMCSYNRINGVYASENYHTLTEILRDEWGFEGMVVSDWGAVHATLEPIEAGLDLEMPGPAKWFGRLLSESAENWVIDEALIDEAARRVLRLIFRVGKMDDPASLPKGIGDSPKHRALAQEVAEESMVLLKNERGTLPLDFSTIHSLAVIGPNAAEARVGGGGSSFLTPAHSVSPLEGLQTKLGAKVQVHYELGADNTTIPPMVAGKMLHSADGKQGVKVEFFNNSTLSGKPAATRQDAAMEFIVWEAAPEQGVEKENFSVRWTGKITAPLSGMFTLLLSSTDHTRLYVDGKLIAENAPQPLNPQVIFTYPERVTTPGQVKMSAGKSYDLKVEFVKTWEETFSVMRLSYILPSDGNDTFKKAVELAAKCDAVVMCMGMPTGYESEGVDRPNMDLPGRQEELIRAVAAVNSNMVVVLNVGSPVAMPWIDEVLAVLLAYYPGQEGGAALARILSGEVNPSGKLTETFPMRLIDSPGAINYPGGHQVFYGERIYVGYRYFDTRDVTPLFPFGHGLSYTSFEYSQLKVPAVVKAGKDFEVSVKVTNTGKRAGKEVVQLYVRDLQSAVDRPMKELKGFAKLTLEPGKSQAATFKLDLRALSFYDDLEACWTAEPGEFEILVGASSRDIRAMAKFTLE